MTPQEKQELANSPPAWMYEFDLGDGIKTPLLAEELRSIHQTRQQMILPSIERHYPAGLTGIKCLDVACNEGYFSHLLYHRGATVRGTDIREYNIQRARAVQEILGYDPARLVFVVEDFLENRDEPESYDLTLFLGLLYHLDNPMGALRNLARITRRNCFIETQLTRQNKPVVSGWGQTGVQLTLPAGLAIHQETDEAKNNLASLSSLSFIPNAEAVRLMLIAAGFPRVERIAACPGMNPQYIANDRGVFVASKQ
jgi:tRNA (mo5U34)-methyltransferase